MALRHTHGDKLSTWVIQHSPHSLISLCPSENPHTLEEGTIAFRPISANLEQKRGFISRNSRRILRRVMDNLDRTHLAPI